MIRWETPCPSSRTFWIQPQHWGKKALHLSNFDPLCVLFYFFEMGVSLHSTCVLLILITHQSLAFPIHQFACFPSGVSKPWYTIRMLFFGVCSWDCIIFTNALVFMAYLCKWAAPRWGKESSGFRAGSFATTCHLREEPMLVAMLLVMDIAFELSWVSS